MGKMIDLEFDALNLFALTDKELREERLKDILPRRSRKVLKLEGPLTAEQLVRANITLGAITMDESYEVVQQQRGKYYFLAVRRTG